MPTVEDRFCPVLGLGVLGLGLGLGQRSLVAALGLFQVR